MRILLIGVVTAATLVAAVIAGIGLQVLSLSIRTPGSAAPPSPSPVTRPTIAYIESTRRTVILADEGGHEVARWDAGGYIESASIDPTGHRIAAWRATETSGEPPFELVIWTPETRAVSVTFQAMRERPVGPPVWGATMVFAGVAQMPRASERAPRSLPRSPRLLASAIDGSARELWASDEGTITPIIATRDVVAAVRRTATVQRYTVLALPSGATVQDIAMPAYVTIRAGEGDLVFGVTQRLTDDPVEELRVWRAPDHGAEVFTFRSPTVNAPRWRAGTSEIVFGMGREIKSVDVQRGTVRTLLHEDALVMPVAVNREPPLLLARRLQQPEFVMFALSDGSTRARHRVELPEGAAVLGWISP